MRSNDGAHLFLRMYFRFEYARGGLKLVRSHRRGRLHGHVKEKDGCVGEVFLYTKNVYKGFACATMCARVYELYIYIHVCGIERALFVFCG